MPDDKRIETVARAEYGQWAKRTNGAEQDFAAVVGHYRTGWLDQAADFTAMRDADDAWRRSIGQPCWSCEGTGVEPCGTEHKDQPADLSPSKAGEDRREDDRRQIRDDFFSGGKRTGRDRRASQSPAPRTEMRDGHERRSGRYTPAKPGGLRGYTARQDDRRAPSPIDTLEAERARPSRKAPSPYYAMLRQVEEDLERSRIKVDALEAENKRLREEVAEAEQERDGAVAQWKKVLDTYTAIEAEFNSMKAELATLRASPLPVTAEELAEAMKPFVIRPDLVTNTAHLILARLSSSRTEAKGASGPAPLTIEAGKLYRTRDGRKVGPMELNKHDEYVWRAWSAEKSSFLYWKKDGEGFDFDRSLIAPWSEPSPPAPPADPNAEADRRLGANLRKIVSDSRGHQISIYKTAMEDGWVCRCGDAKTGKTFDAAIAALAKDGASHG